VALAASTGEVRWRKRLEVGETVQMTPAADGDRVYLGTASGRFLALAVETGESAWVHEGQADYLVTSPVVVSGRVFVGDRGVRGVRSGAVNAFDAKSGALLWSTEFGATGFSTPGVVRDASGAERLVAGFGRSVALFDTRTGARLAEPAIQTGANAFGSPTVIGDTICFGNLDGHFYAHDLVTGALRWAFAMPMDQARGQPHQVYDFTYAHDRIYLSTGLGMFAIVQDPERETAPAGFVLRWTPPEGEAPAKEATAPGQPAASSATATPARTAHTLAEAWMRDAMQIRDAGLRERTIAELRAALEGEDAVARHGALLAITRIGQVAYDKASLRPRILSILKDSQGALRVSAAYALFNTAWEESDLEFVLPIADDPAPEARNSASHLLHLFTKGRIEGPAAAAVERLLGSKNRSIVRETLRGLWGASVSAGVEERLLDLAKDPATRHDAIYFGLSTLEGKSARVVVALVAALGDADWLNVGQRALWGLGHGVPPENQGLVADGLVLLIQARDQPRTVNDAIRTLSRTGVERHAAFLEQLAANPQTTPQVREAARSGATEIRRRAPGGR